MDGQSHECTWDVAMRQRLCGSRTRRQGRSASGRRGNEMDAGERYMSRQDGTVVEERSPDAGMC